MMKLSSLLLSLLVLGLAQLHFSQAQNGPEDFLYRHNTIRRSVGVGPLTWDTGLEAYARKYGAVSRRNDCKLIDSGGPYGENRFWGSGREFTADDAVTLWVNERSDYNYNSNTCNRGQICGHYTQVVWRNSTRLGCANVRCPNDNSVVFIICSYDPRGNYIGQKPY